MPSSYQIPWIIINMTVEKDKFKLAGLTFIIIASSDHNGGPSRD